MARSPRRFGSTPSPTATIRPQQSAPWIRGNASGAPDQPAADPSISPARPAAPAVFVYHPMRVFDVRIVDAGGGHLQKHFAGAGDRRRDIAAVAQLVESPVADENERRPSARGSS